MNKPKVAVSACLLGNPVRYDGGHKRSRFLTDKLSAWVDFVPVCPEVEAGMGVPRPTIHLRRIDQQLRLVDSKSGRSDFTVAVEQVANDRAEQFDGKIAGYVFQQRSPTCGLHRVKVANAEGNHLDNAGRGVFADRFAKLSPLVPLEEEGRLNDSILRENFVERVFALDRWNQLDDTSISAFVEFHVRHKMMLMARGTEAYLSLGHIVAETSRQNLQESRGNYIVQFMEIMSHRVSRGHHCNVLQHMMGYLKRVLDRGDKAELLDVLEAYRSEQMPLVTPLTLMRHHLRQHPVSYLDKQYYLSPYPESLALRAQI